MAIITAPHQDTPRQAEQAAEGNARDASGDAVPPNETTQVLEGLDDGTPQDPGGTRQAHSGDAPPAPTAKPYSLSDEKRAKINARFRGNRSVEGESDGEHAARITTWPEAAEIQAQGEAPVAPAAPEPAPTPVAAPVAAEAPRTVKIKVLGEEKEVPLEEALAKAQTAYAADDYLGAAKRTLKQAEELFTDATNRVARSAPTDGHHVDQNRSQTTEQPQPAPADLRHQEDPYGKLLETMQFGDPEEAKTLLRDTIVREASQVAIHTNAQTRIAEDARRASEVVADFETKHQEIASDPMARAAIEANLYEQQAADLVGLNVDLNRIRQDGRPATPADIANFHQKLRAEGHRVRSPADLLTKATEKFLAWKGATPPAPVVPQPQQQPAPAPVQQGAPRVEISVDRSVRRAAIPQQPSRSAAPQPSPQQQAAPATRSAVVQRMKAARGVPRGQVGVS